MFAPDVLPMDISSLLNYPIPFKVSLQTLTVMLSGAVSYICIHTRCMVIVLEY